MMKLKRSTLNHATVHFGGRVDRLSANLSHEYSGDHAAAGLPSAADVDVPVTKGSALDKAIAHLGALVAEAVFTGSGVDVAPYEAPAVAETPATPKRVRRK